MNLSIPTLPAEEVAAMHGISDITLSSPRIRLKQAKLMAAEIEQDVSRGISEVMIYMHAIMHATITYVNRGPLLLYLILLLICTRLYYTSFIIICIT